METIALFVLYFALGFIIVMERERLDFEFRVAVTGNTPYFAFALILWPYVLIEGLLKAACIGVLRLWNMIAKDTRRN